MSKDYKFEYKRKLILLVGNIASGKSTLVKKYQDKYVVISRDHIRYNLGNGNYVFSLDFEQHIFNTILTLLDGLLQTGVNIIIDETNCKQTIRSRFIELGKVYDYHITAIILPKITKEEALKRRMKAPHGTFNKETWGRVWDMFDRFYTEPNLSEGFDRIIKSKPNKK